MDRSYLYGDGLFETVRVEDGRVYFRDAHAARFQRSATELGYPDATIDAGLRAIGEIAATRDGLCRVTVSRDDPNAPFGGEGGVTVSWRPLPGSNRPRLAAMRGWYWPDDPLAGHKTTSYLRWVEARRRANRAGFDDALLISSDGVVGETSTCNVFVAVDGRLVTPTARGILPGIVRQKVLDNAGELDLPVDVRAVTQDDLAAATEIVCTSAGVLALSAISLDGRDLESSVGPRLRALLHTVA